MPPEEGWVRAKVALAAPLTRGPKQGQGKPQARGPWVWPPPSNPNPKVCDGVQMVAGLEPVCHRCGTGAIKVNE